MTAFTPSGYISKAETALSGARLLLSAGDTDGACNRAYYAMFDAAHAALRAAGMELSDSPVKTHNGLTAMFGQHLVRTRMLDAEHGGNLNRVQSLRLLADDSGDSVSVGDAVWSVEQAGAFVQAVKKKFALGDRG